MNIWRINLKTKGHSIEPVPQGWKDLGGRGLIARILLDEVNPTCDPLGPENKLIFAPGLLAGHRLSSLDRISIGGKSPLTGGVKEANAGGRTAYEMTALGIKALIIEGMPDDTGWNLLYLDKDGVRFEDGSAYAGLGVYQSAAEIIARYGKDIALSLIGPGGEMTLKAAGIQNIDKDLVPSRIAARGGLGAVMGSKRVKAIIFDARECGEPPVHDQSKFKAARKKYT
ncbi:MAG: aldehyde ferredoxin oxidoreductase N-terminal domain-containing protein, partial [Anaerolineales bacterium]